MQEETLDAHSKRLRSLSASIDSSFLDFTAVFRKNSVFNILLLLGAKYVCELLIVQQT